MNPIVDPILAEVYSTVLPAAPYVIGAYLGIWVLLFVLVLAVLFSQKKTAQSLADLHEAIEKLETKLNL